MHEWSTLSDETLMARFQRHLDAAAIEQLATRYLPRGVVVARQILGQRFGAEDAVQDAFVRVIRSRNRYQPTKPFSVWYFTILRNVCLDLLRRRRRQVRAMEEYRQCQTDRSEPDEPADPQAAAALLAALPPIEREAVRLRIVHDLPFRDVAAALGIGEEAAKKRVQRGLRRLREKEVRSQGAGDRRQELGVRS